MRCTSATSQVKPNLTNLEVEVQISWLYLTTSFRSQAEWIITGRLSRLTAVIVQLRSGHCLNLAHYKNRLDDKASPTCPACEEEEETVSHWLQCPATIRTREKIFGREDVSLDTLDKDPTST